MSDVINAAVEALREKLGDSGFDDSVRFEITGEGSVIIDAEGVRAGEGEADCTLRADADTFEAMMDGSLNPTSAFMSGRLAIEGDMGIAMKLGAILA